MSNTHFVGHQTGGSHYQKLAVQPWQYNIKNNLPWAEGEIVKYVSRWPDKNGLGDLEKARDILECLIAEEVQRIEKNKPPVKHPPIMDYTFTESERMGID